MLSLRDGFGDDRLGNTSRGWIIFDEFAKKDMPEGGCWFGS
jgi:hypothetical protein